MATTTHVQSTLAERVLLAIAPSVVESEQFKAYEELRDYFDQHVRPTRAKNADEKLAKLAMAEYEAWRRAHVEVSRKNIGHACVSLSFAIVDAFEDENAKRLADAMRPFAKDMLPKDAKY
jgi:hypothetical protein